MDVWVGPAIVAALISGLVSLIVVQLNFRAALRTERVRRGERVRDFQIALKAEIASDLANMRRFDRSELLRNVADAMEADPLYTPVVPRLSANPIFDAIVKELPILPEGVIAPVVDYERLRQSLGQFVDDLRSDLHINLSADRRLLAYADYVATYDLLEALAETAIRSLDASLTLNKTAVARTDYRPARDGASAGSSSS